MEQFFRLVVYIIAANIAYLVFSLIKQGFKHYSNYIAQLLFLMICILWMLQRNVDSGLVFLVALIGVIILIFLPVKIQSKIDELMADNRLDEIEFWAKLKANIAWSYPNSHLQDLSEIASKYFETPMKMIEKLRELLGRGEPYDGMTRLFLGLIHFNNRNFNDLITDLRIPDKSFDEHSFEVLLYLIRAYLETTRFDEAVEAQFALEKKINEDSDNKYERENNAIINRFVFYAFMGWKEEYDEFLKSGKAGLERLPQELRDFWRGVCYFYSGSYDDGEQQMRAVVDKLPEEAFVFKEFMQKRMFGMIEHKRFFDEHVLPKLKELHQKYHNEYIELIKKNEIISNEIIPQSKVTNILTFCICLLSILYIIVFNVNDSIELIELGAVSSFLVKNGEYFRLLSYIFIHAGWLHLIMNLFALKYFGPPVETIVGWQAMLAIFIGSGIAGGALSVYMNNPLTIGASGGVLGLLSASIIFELFKLKGSNNFSNQSNISTLIFILAINIGFGFYETGIDNAAHFGGLIAGAILGFVFVLISKMRVLKIIENFLIIFIISLVFGYSFLQHISILKSKSLYPQKVNNYQECNIASASFRLDIPEGWNPETDSVSFQKLNIKGSLGEKLNVAVGLNTDSPEIFLNEFIQQRSRDFEQEDELELVSVSSPEPFKSRANSYKIVWKIKAYGRINTWIDGIIFEDNLACDIGLIIGSNHNDRYDSLMEHLVSSLHFR